MLDLGCGTGVFMEMMAQAACSCVGLDLSREMLEVAHGRILRSELSARMSLVRADAGFLPFRDDSFGGVVSVGMVLAHLPSYRRGVGQVARVLRREGSFLLEFDNKWSIDFLHYLVDISTGGRLLGYGFSRWSQLSRYVRDGAYDWTPAQDGLPVSNRALLHKISAWKLLRLLRDAELRKLQNYGIHFATLFLPKEFPHRKEHSGVSYVDFAEWLDSRLSRYSPFSYLGGSIILSGKKKGLETQHFY